MTIQEKLKAIAEKDRSEVSAVEALAKRKAEEYHIPYDDVVDMLYNVSLGLSSALCDP